MTEVVKAADFKLATHSYQEFDAIVDPSMGPDDLIKNEMWTHVAGMMKPGGEIRCIARDYTFVAKLLITFVQGTLVRTKLISFVKLEETPTEVIADPDFKVEYREADGWSVINLKTGEVMQNSLENEAAAHLWMAQHIAALKR